MGIWVLWRSARPSFLSLTLVCVFLGISTLPADESVALVPAALALTGALLAHMSVNLLNEYWDFQSGLDGLTRKTAFSGGSGALPAHPAMAKAVGLAGLGCLLGSASIGGYFYWLRGPAILPVELAGGLLIITYTQWLNRQPWLCLVAPDTGFGLMVVGSHWAVSGTFTDSESLGFAAAVVFFLINNLLLLNQYPDLTADATVGRRHLPIVAGIGFSNQIYLSFLLSAAALIMVGLWRGTLPPASAVALAPLPLGLYAWWGAKQWGARLGEQPRFLAANVLVTLLTPALLALALMGE